VPTLHPTRDLLFPRIPNLDDSEIQEELEEQANGLQRLLDDLREQLAEIDADKQLSQDGRRAKRQEAVQKLREAARVVGRVEDTRKTAGFVAKRREGLLSPEFRFEDMDTEGLGAIRKFLRSQPGPERERLLREAAANGNSKVVAAAELDPLTEAGLDPIVTDDVLAAVREIHSRTVAPEKWDKVDRRARAADYHTTNLERADEVARELSGGERLFPRDTDEFRALHGDE